MMRTRLFAVLWFFSSTLAAVPAHGQMWSTATARRLYAGTLPATCINSTLVVDVWVNGGDIYVCTATNTWTQKTASAGTFLKADGTTTGATSQAQAFTNGMTTAGSLTFSAASAKIIPGVTSLLFRDTADANTNVTIADAGTVTLRVALPFGSGGTGLSSAADDTVMVSSGSTWVAKAVPDCTDSTGNHLNYTASTNTISCGTSSSASGANTALSNLVAPTTINVPLQAATAGLDITTAAGVAQVTSGGSNYGVVKAGNVVAQQLATPSAPTNTPVGTDNGKAFTYKVIARFADGSQSLASSASAANAHSATTLTGGNYNTVTWSAVTGAYDYRVFRASSNATPSTLGVIGTVLSTASLTFNDTGGAGDGSTANTLSQTGKICSGFLSTDVCLKNAQVVNGYPSWSARAGDDSSSANLLSRSWHAGIAAGWTDGGIGFDTAVNATEANSTGVQATQYCSWDNGEYADTCIGKIVNGVWGFGYANAATAARTSHAAFYQYGGTCIVASDQTNATTTLQTAACYNTTSGSAAISLLAGRTYTGKCELYLSDSIAADGAKMDFNGGTATATTFRAQVTAFDTALNLSQQCTALTCGAGGASASTFTGAGSFEIHFGLKVNAAGTFQPQFAQVAHTAGTLTLAALSYCKLEDATP